MLTSFRKECRLRLFLDFKIEYLHECSRFMFIDFIKIIEVNHKDVRFAEYFTRLINPIIHIYRMTLKDFEIAFFV